jgi:PAS domain S-box-containing protein
VSELSIKNVLAPSMAYLRRMALIAAVIVLFGAIGAWWFSRRFTSPLRRLTTAAAAIAGGDLVQRVDVPGTDELGRLGSSFNFMAGEVKRSRENLEGQVVERTRELRDSEARLRAVTETAHDAIVAADGNGNIAYWNPGAGHMFGYEASEVIGQPLTMLMPERYQEDHRRGIQRYTETSEMRVVGRTVELHGRRKNGAEFPLELSLAAARTAAGVSFTGVIRDITERKRIEQALRETNAELEAFSYSVSHDLRAPLRAIHGFARILLEDHGPNLDPEAKRVLGVIDENTRRMGQLIDDLLSFSRLGRKELENSRVDMADLVRTIAEDVRRTAGDRPLEIAVGPLPPARGDRDMLRQVITNLLDNASKFTRRRTPGRIDVGHRSEGQETVYFVKDNGAGFDPRYGGKLFGVFQRLHKAEEFEGTGVGLAIVQRIVLRHGGRVWAEGQLDQGATFFFTLRGVADA